MYQWCQGGHKIFVTEMGGHNFSFIDAEFINLGPLSKKIIAPK